MNSNSDLTARAIIHVDMDAFYASVEQRDRPELTGKPVIVGGLGRRGVVSAASYEARRFGVHSAMPMIKARQLCPQGEYLRPRMAHYRAVSRAVFGIFREITPAVQGLSLDEAFLDVTANQRLLGDLETIGRLVKTRIKQRLRLVASVGMASNKFLAKLASDFDKPDGFYHVRDADIHRFLDPMPVGRLWGIGPKTVPRLNRLGIYTVGQLRQRTDQELVAVLGNRTAHFMRLARGEDERPVESHQEDKSISHEVTFEIDLTREKLLLARLQQLSEQVGVRLREHRLSGRTVQVKIRDRHFRTYTRSRTLRAATQSSSEIYAMARALFSKWQTQYPAMPVRLLGVGMHGLEDIKQDKDSVDVQEPPLDKALDEINQRYGQALIGRGLARLYREDK